MGDGSWVHQASSGNSGNGGGGGGGSWGGGFLPTVLSAVGLLGWVGYGVFTGGDQIRVCPSKKEWTEGFFMTLNTQLVY